MNPALEAVNRWMSDYGLKIYPFKSEAVLLTCKWPYQEPRLLISGHVFEIKKSLRYLGLELDQRLTFTQHIDNVTRATAETTRAIGRLMSNISGSNYLKRNLQTSVVQSKIFYASSIWANTAIITAKNRKAIYRTQRLSALWIIRGYRTVSDDASLMLSRIPPGNLLIQQCQQVRLKKSDPHSTSSALMIRNVESQTAIEKGAWTRKILPDLSRWYKS